MKKWSENSREKNKEKPEPRTRKEEPSTARGLVIMRDGKEQKLPMLIFVF